MEFMCYVRNRQDAKLALSEEAHLEFVKKCETYIGELKKENKLIAAQPIHREGTILRKSGNGWTKEPSDPEEIQVGYYHIVARDLDEAISIARRNPEFEYVPSASVEVKQIKTKEAVTGFEYPRQD